MRGLVVVGALALAGSAAMADIAEPVSAVNYAKYNMATGKVKVGGGNHRTHRIAWDSTSFTGFFSNRVSTQWVVDWGDVPAGNLVLDTVDGFQIGYATNRAPCRSISRSGSTRTATVSGTPPMRSRPSSSPGCPARAAAALRAGSSTSIWSRGTCHSS